MKSATLTQASDGPSTLSLEWGGFGPEWLEYMEPVAVIHRGVALFAGRVTAFSRSNSGGEVTTSATVQDALWLTDHQTLGAQVAEIEAESSSSSMQQAAQSALESWAALAESCNIAAPGGWVVREDGTPDDDGLVYVDTEQATAGVAPTWKREKGITAYTALLTMKQANPDAFFRYRPTSGAVEIVSISKAQGLTWDTAKMRITEAADVGPQYENQITGVALVISVDAENSDDRQEVYGAGSAKQSCIFLYPEDISPSDMGVHVISASVSSRDAVERQQAYMMAQIRAYYDATNALMYGGRVTALMADVRESPLCRRLNLTGPGTHASWGTMAAMVTAVEWDFVGGTCTATLGANMQQPNIAELEIEATHDDVERESDDSTTSEEPGLSSKKGSAWRESNVPTGPWWTWRSNSEDESSSKSDGISDRFLAKQKILNSLYFLDKNADQINDTTPALILQRLDPDLYVDGLAEAVSSAGGGGEYAAGLMAILEYERKLRAENRW